MNAKWTILGKKFATLCILPLAAVSGCMSLNAPDRADKAKGAENMQVRIAELEILPEWLDAYLEAAGAVGAESVAKEPGVVCIFPMQKKESPTSIRIVEPHMIKSLELVPMHPLDPEHANGIFRKWL